MTVVKNHGWKYTFNSFTFFVSTIRFNLAQNFKETRNKELKQFHHLPSFNIKVLSLLPGMYSKVGPL